MTAFRSCVLVLPALLAFACKKSPGDPAPAPPQPPVVVDTVVLNPTPDDPAIANSIGFFLNDWAAKTFTAPTFKDTSLPQSASTVTVNIDAATVITKVPSSTFGQNANIWMTQMITEPSLMNYMTNLKANPIRFPGGSISDVFFWNAEPGTPPGDAPATLPDADGKAGPSNFWFGKNADSWTFSVENYYKMLQQTGSYGMITVNYGYARYGTGADPVASAAHLAADWVRYDNGRTKYWEIGNENNGTWEAGYRIDVNNNKDGQPQLITGDLYGRHYNVFVDSMRAAAQEIGKTIYIGAQLLEKEPEAWQTSTDKTWNTGVLAQVKSNNDFYIIHSYFTPYQTNASADVILNTAIDNTGCNDELSEDRFCKCRCCRKARCAH